MEQLFDLVFCISTRMHCIPFQWTPSAPVLKLTPITRRRDLGLYYTASAMECAYVVMTVAAYVKYTDPVYTGDFISLSSRVTMSFESAFFIMGPLFMYINHAAGLKTADFTNKQIGRAHV